MLKSPSEPIAIVGMACRFPGADDIEAFWRLLETGGNAVTERVPGSETGRWGQLFGARVIENKSCSFGAFVNDIDRFDDSFFRISPVEAQLLDPQQRMMLEVSWHALEDAGINPDLLRGSRTGVYTGISNDEYRMLVVDSAKPSEAAACLYALSGTNLNGTSGRVSFVLDLKGPAKAVDAACASAMVAVHDAVSDLQQSKADVAIAGGVQAILNGRIYELRADSMMLSPDGQCKAFDASANGYVRAEGCGAVILKRLRDAEADGDRIQAVIRAAAMNHGGTGVGLTVPNTPALEQLMADALSQAGVAANEVDYLEAHGTGTAVGDPIELNAVANVYCHGRPSARPLLIGSVKTNLGHLESAAGIAGLIKTALMVERGAIPKHLHFHDPNPGFDWDSAPIQVTSEQMDWPGSSDRPRLAGVNCFGISGTNAHLVVEQYRARDRAAAVGGRAAEPVVKPRRTRLLPLSGKTDAALRELARRYLSWLDRRAAELAEPRDGCDPLLSDMAWTAGVGRSHFDHRAGIVFDNSMSLREQLARVADAAGVDEAPPRADKLAFAYTGQGSQWAGMGRNLYECEPAARAVIDRCDAIFRDCRNVSLLEVMFGQAGNGGENLGDTAWEQPALYTLGCALTALWSNVGVRPSVVIGHSVGEITAAHAAGVFSLEDGMRFACARGAIMSGMESGAMAAVFAPAARVAAALDAHNSAIEGAGVSISADNGAHMVVSGPVQGIEAVSREFVNAGIRVRRLNTAKAFHSALVEPILDALEASLDDVPISPPSITLVSNLTGQAVADGQTLDGPYWRRHAREAVAFALGVRTMADLGIDRVIEIGPRPVLAPMALSAWPHADRVPAPTVLASMHPPSSEGTVSGRSGDFHEAAAEAFQAGISIGFEGLFTGESRRRISLPGYPFGRMRHWLDAPGKRRDRTGHPLLGDRHESACGEITYESDLSPSNPVWLDDHRVFDRVIAPGALYGAMAASAALAEGSGTVEVEDFQLLTALAFPEDGAAGPDGKADRQLQLVLSQSNDSGRPVQIYSRERSSGWIQHAGGNVSLGGGALEADTRLDLDRLKASLSPVDVDGYYRARAETGVGLGPSFRTLTRAWSGSGEALGEVSLPDGLGRGGLDIHPLVLDGCFQTVGVARDLSGPHGTVTYLPFGWERFWLTSGRLPERVICHVRLGEGSRNADADPDNVPETMTAELRIHNSSGALLGGMSGYSIKRATPAALLPAADSIEDLLYEVQWRERPLPPGMLSAHFFPDPAAIKSGAQLFAGYLADAGVDPDDRDNLLGDLEQWSWSFALATLDKLGWRRKRDVVVDAEELRERLEVQDEHRRLFRRVLELAARTGALSEQEDGRFAVLAASDDPWPSTLPQDPVEHASEMTGRYPNGLIEAGLFRRSGAALPEVLRGREDPLTLLFSSGEPTAADLYLKAPVARAANQMLAEAVRGLVAALPEGRRLRVIEVGAGTGSATASVLPELPEAGFDYVYTDISAGFFAEAEARFGDAGGCIEYRPLDIEKDPFAQGFDAHGYDVIIASNVLHATRYLDETLDHCRRLLAPGGQLVALENLSGLGWMDLTFGQLDGWWRFADSYRPHHALASPAVWRQALGDAGFDAVEVLGVDEADSVRIPDKGVIVAQGPAAVKEPPGVWILAADNSGMADKLAIDLAAHNQTVLLAVEEGPEDTVADGSSAGVFRIRVDMAKRESWQLAVAGLPGDIPLKGLVHLLALDGCGAESTADDIAGAVGRMGASALAMVQGVTDADTAPDLGLWFVTRGAQFLEFERGGEPAGSALWGFGKAVAREAAHLRPRMIDLDPGVGASEPDLVNELMYPDNEDHIALRAGRRHVARLVRAGSGTDRLALPDDREWVLAPDPDGVFDRPSIQRLPARTLEPREVRVAVAAAGINFWDVFRSLGFIEEGLLGREMCGHILDIGSEVASVAIGDKVVGMGFGAFGPQMITHEALVAPAPPDVSATELATIPSAFVSAALSFESSGLEVGERVLIHAGAGGVGLAAIQLVQAAGAEVYATSSAPKQGYLRSLGVKHVFDSRTTAFAGEIMAATDGAGVDIVLNSLTGEGFIDASLSCLKQGGRFVEMARRDILSHDEMAAARPDVAYDILELDVLKKTDPERVGRVLRAVMERIEARELKPIIHSRWPLAEAGAALSFMRSARHLGKIVLTTPPIKNDRLRADRTYLVTGGLGGIGCALAGWLADRGAGAIVLNGRRPPNTETEEIIRKLRQRGVNVRVELADVTDGGAVDRMLALIDRELPPLGGVVHSVGVLSDGALTNQTWDRFKTVLWPKILGAWHLHRATLDRDLDMFVLFSSRVGVMGNPGQSNHAAANAFLDQLARRRRAMGLPGQAIAWGAWSEIGEAAEQRDRIDRQRSALGGRWFTPEQGLKAFDRLVREDVAHAVVMSIDWSVFEEAVAERPRLVEDLLSAASEAATDGADSRKDLLSRFGETLPAERENLVVSFLQDEVQAVLRLPSAPAPTVGFFDLGMDSLMAVELRNRLNRALSGAYTAPNTLVFDYPDIAALATHLAGELATDGEAPAALPLLAAEPSGQLAAAPEALSDDNAIAIVGMACRFPGAPDLQAFWRLLEDAADLVTDGRRDPGPWRGVAGNPDEGDGYSRRGAFLEDIDKFDAAFFGIRPIEARTMDPRQRLLLETTWHALEDAGMDPARLKGSRTGVYIGTGNGDYRDVAAAGGESHGYLGTTMSVTAGRISFTFGLAGPAIAMDLACASSLAAIHQAASALRLREVETALVGGVNAILSSEVTAFMREVGMLSARGRCSAFDADADGFVRGEGCGVVVLKRLSEARADCDRIWGVIRGSAVNQNGSSAGLTVPNGPAQEQVIEEALSRAGVPPAEVDFLEAHGAGSGLGDPIEVQAAAAVYGRERDPDHPLLIGSVKTNIGHLECAAGVASLIKTLLAMNKGRIPKQLHFRNPSTHLDWNSLPVQVIDDVTEWPSHPGRPPRAGVSSFGISGTNSHVIVEGNAVADGSSALTANGALPAGPIQPVKTALPGRDGGQPSPEGGVCPRATRVLPLSAKSPQALRTLASKYLAWLDERRPIWTEDGDASAALLADMAWTAGIGRSHLGHRAGIVFHDVESLRDGLTGLATGSRLPASSPDGPVSATTPKLAFAFGGDEVVHKRAGRQLYDSEPVFRAILDRCDAVIGEERGGASLLNVMFGNGSSDRELRGPEWVQPAVYALECGLTALWESVGMLPDAVAGRGVGGLVAAWAAGVVTLENGLRLAAARGADFARPRARVSAARPTANDSESKDDRLAEFDAVLASVEMSPPSMALVSEVDMPAADAAKPLDASFWRKQMLARQSPDRQASRLADLNVAMVLDIGAPSMHGLVPLSAWPASAGSPHADFAGLVAAAYNEGFPVSFGGLFAGEMRRRISVPSYPFQRRRHWIEVRD